MGEYFLRKQFFMYNPIPEISYTDEILAMQPTVLNGVLERLNQE